MATTAYSDTTLWLTNRTCAAKLDLQDVLKKIEGRGGEQRFPHAVHELRLAIEAAERALTEVGYVRDELDGREMADRG